MVDRVRAIRTGLVSAFLIISCSEEPSLAPSFKGYFGQPIPSADAETLDAFYRGERLFIRDWTDEADGVANSNSCASCHSVPAPAGSGMAEISLVVINPHEPPGSREEIAHVSRRVMQTSEVRRTPALFGIGYLEAFGESEFKLGAFARQTDLSQFVSAAFATELGVSTGRHCSRLSPTNAYPKDCDARITPAELNDVLVYLRYLAPPPQPSNSSQEVERLFQTLGCASCHTPEVTTAKVNVENPFSNKIIFPYSDMRLHDIGTSSRGAIRTAPLWGLNSFGPPYLHNGAAKSIEEAVLAHANEGQGSKDAYLSSSFKERQQFLDYLRSF